MSDFQREDRYLVIKYSDMEKLPNDVRRNFSGRCRNFYEQMLIAGAPARSFLVIESDWPEYEPVWQMIERRVTGLPAVTAAEELEAVLHWRGKHAQAIRERDALQERLNAADQRIDELTQRHCEHPEGKRERFEKWVMAIKHPVFGFLDGRSLARSDERTGYADEYVQGLWVAFLALAGFVSRDDSIGWLKRIDGIGQNRAELIYSMGFRRLAD